MNKQYRVVKRHGLYCVENRWLPDGKWSDDSFFLPRTFSDEKEAIEAMNGLVEHAKALYERMSEPEVEVSVSEPVPQWLPPMRKLSELSPSPRMIPESQVYAYAYATGVLGAIVGAVAFWWLA